MSDIVDFYLGNKPHQGFGSILQVLEMDAAEFGKHQGLVKSVFPITLEQADIESLKTNKTIRDRYLVFFQKMMHFYGLNLENLDYQRPLITRLPFNGMRNFERDILAMKQRSIVLHILNSLYLLGFNQLADRLIQYVQDRIQANRDTCSALQSFAQSLAKINTTNQALVSPLKNPTDQTRLLSVNQDYDSDDNDAVRCSFLCGCSFSFFKSSNWPDLNPIHRIRQLFRK